MKKSCKSCNKTRVSAEKRDFLVSNLRLLRDGLASEKCAALLLAVFHGSQSGRPACPICRAQLGETSAATWRAGRRVKCLACGKQFSPWQGTPLQGGHMSPADFILFRVALAAGLDHTGLRQLLKRHSQFVTAWTPKVRASFDEMQMQTGVPADENRFNPDD